MTYRTIDVNGTEHQYIIGKQFVKIRGLGAFPKEDFGNERIKHRCELCGEASSDCPEYDNLPTSIRVRPEHIRQFILGAG